MNACDKFKYVSADKNQLRSYVSFNGECEIYDWQAVPTLLLMFCDVATEIRLPELPIFSRNLIKL